MVMPTSMAKTGLVKKLKYNLIDEFTAQSQNHPDESLRAFYLASIDFYQNNRKFREILHSAVDNRSGITSTHFVNLMYRAFQYILLFEKSVSGLDKFTKKHWLKELKELLESEESLLTYQELLEKESTQTTIYQRYAGPKAVISAIFDGKPLKVVDLGCGLNLGLPGLELNYPFKKIEDNTPQNTLSSLLNNKVFIKNGLSIDLVDPVQKRKWALVCGFYPGELKSLPETDRLCDYLWANTNIKFFKESLLNVSALWKKHKFPKYDVAITSTVLYQLSEKDQAKALKEIRKILKLGGVLIVNDFVNVNHKIHFVNWFKKGTSNYKTVVLVADKTGFSTPLEFIKWDTARCRSAEAGKDFKKVLELHK